MVNTEIRLIIFFAAKDGETLYSQQKQDWELTVAEIMNSLLPKLEKEMATHSSVHAWRIPGMAEPGRLLSMGLHRVGHDWSDLASAAAAFRYGLNQIPYDYTVEVTDSRDQIW